MSLPRAFLDEIRARVPVSDVVGKRTKLTRAGREYKGCCPFHKEKSPSFYVNDQKAFYHCFGCGVHGDVVKFLMDHDNMAFMDAVEQLAGIAGLQVPKPSPEEQKKFQRQMSLYDLMEQAAKFYEQQLHDAKNKKILNYLLERGLSIDTIKSFRLGFSGGDENALKQFLAKAGYKPDDMLEAGMFKESQRNKNEIYPFFRDRVMFPVQDFQGRVVAFGGRVLPEAYGGPAGKEAPKYINSPETAIFHKGRMLYGLSRARKVIGDGETAIVVEGYMDVIALAQAGFRAAVAPLGTALTETQVEELWKAMPEDNRAPVLCFDGDAAGQRAATRSLERILPILKPDHSVKFVFLPEQHDPDSLIKEEGVQAMQKVLDHSIGIFDMMWNEEAKGRNFSQPETKAGFRAALDKRARQISNGTVQEFFLHEINQKVNEVFLSLKSGSKNSSNALNFKNNQFKKGNISALNQSYRPLNKETRSPKVSKLLREKVLMAVMINYPELFDVYGEQFGMIEIPNSEYDQVRQDLLHFLIESQNKEIHLDDQAVRQHLTVLGHGKILDAIFDKSLYLHAGFAKPGQPPETVRQGWQDTYARGMEQSRWHKQ